MILLIFTLPLLGSLIPAFLGKYIGNKWGPYISTILLVYSTLIIYYYFYYVTILGNIYIFDICNYIHIDIININWAFLLDDISITLLVAVGTVGSLVHIYALGYMEHDPYTNRFFSILSMFTAFMMLLVLGNNYMIMFIGWEMIGVASYALIGFWYTRLNAAKSGLNALLVNKFGDTFLTLGLFLLLYTFGSLNYSLIFSISHYINTNILIFIMLCLLLGATAKSAQLGLHTWLLNSMEGPTPVSALLHAACLVCAGIYLLLRSCFILEYTPIILIIILWLGGLTTIIAGTIAIVSNDIKKIIALSTMSQLGMMMVAIGISSYNSSLYHLLCHAMFKALLFMSAGSIIHSIISESQDIRYAGSFINYLPITYIAIIIASFALMAIPGLSGFYSKDFIIESLYGNYTISGYIVYIFSFISAMLTTIYSTRLIYLIFFNIPNSNKYTYYNLHESSYKMLIPMIILVIFSIFIGYLTRDIYLGMGTSLSNIFIHPNNDILIDTEFTLPIYIKILPLIFILLLIITILYIYEYYYTLLYIYTNKLLYNLYIFSNNKYMFDQIINNIILTYTLYIGILLSYYIDKGLLYILGPTGIPKLLNILSYNTISLSTERNYRNNTLYIALFILFILLTFFNCNLDYIFIYIITFLILPFILV